MREAFTWLAIKNAVKYFRLPSFRGVSDLISALKLKNGKNIGMREEFTWLAIKNAVKYFSLPFHYRCLRS